MARTRLRGIELAGTRLAVEAPPGFDWDWPESGLARHACAPLDPDVHVGVTIGRVAPPDWDPITYSFEGGTFDVGLVGDEWWMAIHRIDHRFERVACFDRSFSEGVVTISPGAVESCRHPLDGPLLDLLLIHRTIGAGGLVLSGTAIVDRGRALAILSPEDQRIDASRPSLRAWLRKDADGVVQTPGTRFVVRMHDGVARVYGLPGSFGHSEAAVSGRLDAVHLLSRTERVEVDPLSASEAIHALVEHACAPVHAPEMAEQLLDAAESIGGAVPVLRLGVPVEQRVVPFDWGQREASLGFARPHPA